MCVIYAGLGLGPDEASEDDSDGDDDLDEEGNGAAKVMGGSGLQRDDEADEDDEDDEDSDGELMEVERKALKLDRARCGAQSVGGAEGRAICPSGLLHWSAGTGGVENAHVSCTCHLNHNGGQMRCGNPATCYLGLVLNRYRPSWGIGLVHQ